MSGINLYEVHSLYQHALDEAEVIAEQNLGVIPDDLAAKLDGLEMALDDKLENSVKFVKNLMAERDAVDIECNRLAAKAESLNNRIAWMKNYLSLVVKPGEKHKFTAGNISWRPSIFTEITDESLIPTKYKTEKVEISINKTAIKDDIEKGVDVPGAKLNKKNNIQIR